MFHRLAAVAAALLLLAGCSGTTKGSTAASGEQTATNRTADPNAPLKEGLKIASEVCIYTNDRINIEELDSAR